MCWDCCLSPPEAISIPTDRELLLQRLLGTVNPAQPVVQKRSGITDLEVLLQSMLPVTSVAEDSVPPPTDHLEPTTRCFSCGEVIHVTPLCPVLDELFPFLPLGWRRIGRTMNLCCSRPRGGQLSSSGKRRLIRGGGLVSRISNDDEPQFLVVREDLEDRVGAVR